MGALEEELKQMILERYKSIREFTNVIDMPYSTIDSVLKRGINKASINTVIRICRELKIDTEKLAGGTIESTQKPNTLAAHFDGTEYTEEELDEIRRFAEFVKNKRK